MVVGQRHPVNAIHIVPMVFTGWKPLWWTPSCIGFVKKLTRQKSLSLQKEINVQQWLRIDL